MEAQMKRGFLEACVLAAISSEESYGYQIVKDVPACMELTESGRLRKYYRITPAGRERIKEFLAEWPSIQEIYRYVEGVQS